MEDYTVVYIIIGLVVFGYAIAFLEKLVRTPRQKFDGLGPQWKAAIPGTSARTSGPKSLELLQMRIVESTTDDEGIGPKAKSLEIRGLLPVSKTVTAAFVTSVYDNTDGRLETVLCPIEIFQEPHSTAFQIRTEVGSIGPGQGTVEWTKVGGVIPDFLIPPRKGVRKFRVTLRLVDVDNEPTILLGGCEPGHPGLLWQSWQDFEWDISDPGYEEAAEQRDEAQALVIKIGMAVAMADGSLATEEGLVLKDWILKALAPFTGERRERLKKTYNEAMRSSFKAAKAAQLNFGELTRQLNEVADRAIKYETIELCYDVMKADGIFGSEEASLVRSVSRGLDLDHDEVAKIRDQKLVSTRVNIGGDDSVEELIGIDLSDEPSTIRRQLVKEFSKWNARLNTLPAGEERDNAQRMLDLVADARKKYG